MVPRRIFWDLESLDLAQNDSGELVPLLPTSRFGAALSLASWRREHDAQKLGDGEFVLLSLSLYRYLWVSQSLKFELASLSWWSVPRRLTRAHYVPGDLDSRSRPGLVV